MKKLILPEDEQILAMLEGKLHLILKDYLKQEFNIFCINKYITVDRNKILAYLKKYPNLAEKYYERLPKVKIAHDFNILCKEKNLYKIITMDHGQERWVKKFNSLEEAVTEHVLIAYGVYVQ